MGKEVYFYVGRKDSVERESTMWVKRDGVVGADFLEQVRRVVRAGQSMKLVCHKKKAKTCTSCMESVVVAIRACRTSLIAFIFLVTLETGQATWE